MCPGGGGGARPQTEFKLVNYGVKEGGGISGCNAWLTCVCKIQYYDTADCNGSRPAVTEEQLCRSKDCFKYCCRCKPRSRVEVQYVIIIMQVI